MKRSLREVSMAALDDANRLLALQATGLLDTPPEENFDRLTRLASRILRVPVSLISLVGADRQFFKSQVGLPAPYDTARETPLTHSFCQHVVTNENILSVSDAKADPRLRDNLAMRDLGVVAYLGVPLCMPDGSVLGSLCAIDREDREWEPEDISALWGPCSDRYGRDCIAARDGQAREWNLQRR